MHQNRHGEGLPFIPEAVLKCFPLRPLFHGCVDDGGSDLLQGHLVGSTVRGGRHQALRAVRIVAPAAPVPSPPVPPIADVVVVARGLVPVSFSAVPIPMSPPITVLVHTTVIVLSHPSAVSDKQLIARVAIAVIAPPMLVITGGLPPTAIRFMVIISLVVLW